MTIHNEWPALPKIARIADFKERRNPPYPAATRAPSHSGCPVGKSSIFISRTSPSFRSQSKSYRRRRFLAAREVFT